MRKKNTRRMVIIAPHPVQYHVGLYRAIENFGIDNTVLYCDTMGLTDEIDITFGISFKLDIPLLDGYKSHFMKNFNLSKGMSFFSRINPGVIRQIRKYDIILIHGHLYKD